MVYKYVINHYYNDLFMLCRNRSNEDTLRRRFVLARFDSVPVDSVKQF